MPKLVVLSDFARYRVRDLDTGTEAEFGIDDLADRVELFAFPNESHPLSALFAPIPVGAEGLR